MQTEDQPIKALQQQKQTEKKPTWPRGNIFSHTDTHTHTHTHAHAHARECKASLGVAGTLWEG